VQFIFLIHHKCWSVCDCPQVRIDRLNTRWTSSLGVGVLAVDKFCLAVSAVSLKQPCWLVQDQSVFHSSVKVINTVYTVVFPLLANSKARPHDRRCSDSKRTWETALTSWRFE